MVPQLITQVDSDAPLVVVVGASGVLRSEITRALTEHGLQALVVSEEACVNTLRPETLGEAYKVIWIISPIDYLSHTAELCKQRLAPYSKKMVLLQPVLDEPVEYTASDFHSVWNTVAERQKTTILDLNTWFPTAHFVFAKNVLGTPFFPLEICAIHSHKNILYDPNSELSLLTIPDLVNHAVPLFFRPAPQQSICFVGETLHSSSISEEFARLSAAYFQKELHTKIEELQFTQSIPFPVIHQTVEISVPHSVVDSFVRAYRHETSPLRSIAPHSFELQLQIKSSPKPVSQPGIEVAAPPAPVCVEPVPMPVQEVPVELPFQPAQPVQQAEPEPVSQENYDFLPQEPQQPQEKQPQPEKSAPLLPFQIQRAQAAASMPVETIQPYLQPTNSISQEFLAEQTQKTAEITQKPRKQLDPLDINKELSNIFKSPRTAEKVARVEKMAHTELRQNGKQKRKHVLFYGGLSFIGLGLGIVMLGVVFWTTHMLVQKQLLTTAKAAMQQRLSVEDTEKLQKLSSFLGVQATSYSLLFDLAAISEAEHLVSVTNNLIETSSTLEKMEAANSLLYARLMGADDGSVFEVSDELATQAETAYENLSLAQAGIDQISFSGSEEEKEVLLEAYTKKLEELRGGLLVQQQLLPLFRDLFGGSKKTYLILFQNEQELRPTGGFIQAAALVTFSEGRLIATQVFSSYDIDAMVAGDVAPPDDLSRFLGEQQWYFRDSNWHPDFPQTAAKAAWFMNKAVGGTVDGVVGLTLASTSTLIDALGPLEIPEYNEVITSDTLPALMEHHSEKLLVENTTKKAYPVLILERLLEKLKTIQPEKSASVFTALSTSLDEKTLVVSSTQEPVQAALTTFGWTGALIRPECPAQFSSDTCTVDVVAQVAANTGVNKANYYLREKVAHEISLLPGVAQHKRTIQLENTATLNSWPKGDYRGYYRLYLTAGATVNKVTINTVEVPLSDRIERLEQGRSMVGFLVVVPIAAQTEVVVEYSVPLSGEAAYSYAFFDQKQPGTTPDTQVTILPYSGLRPAKIAPQAEVTDGGIVFSSQNRKSHGFYGVEFR